MSVTGVFLVVLLVSCSYAAPHESKPFYRHVEDFVGVIIAESGLELERLVRHYSEDNDFGTVVTYFRTTNFRDLWHEVQTLPEFKAVIDYLDDAQTDIVFCLDKLNELFDQNDTTRSRKRPHGRGNESSAMNIFISESIGYFPKSKLAALFEQKMKEDSSFQHSMEKLKSNEWERLYDALWKNAQFKRAVHTVREHGLDVRILIEQVIAAFGQN